MWFINDRNGDERPRTETRPEDSSSKPRVENLKPRVENGRPRPENGKLRGEEMTMQCGICEHTGDLSEAPPFLCFNCCDAIRRLVWISEHEQARAVRLEPAENTERAAARAPKSASLGRR